MNDDIRIEYWPLSELLEAPINPKEHDLPGIGASMRRFGYTDPVMVDERTGRLVRGHGRREELLSMKESGGKPPLRVRVREDGEWLVPVVRGVSFNSDDEALAYSLADNKLTEKGGWDKEALAGVINQLLADGGPEALEGTGFTEEDMAILLDRIDADIDEPSSLDDLTKEYGEPGERDFWPWVKVQVSPETMEKYEAVMAALPGRDDAEKLVALQSRT